jgi:hypothetical protein
VSFLNYHINEDQFFSMLQTIQPLTLPSPQKSIQRKQQPQKQIKGSFTSNYNFPAFQGYFKPKSMINFAGSAKKIENLRDKPLDHLGKITQETLHPYDIAKNYTPTSPHVVPVVELTEAPISLKPFDDKEFGPYKPHYIVEADGYKGLFKFSLFDGYISREVGARVLSKLTGLDSTVPETIYARVNTPDYGVKLGSLQSYIEGAEHILEKREIKQALADEIKSTPEALNDLRKVVTYNYLAQNIDTGMGNWVTYRDDAGKLRIKSIDHALTGSAGAGIAAIADKFPELSPFTLTDEEKVNIETFIHKEKENKEILTHYYPPEAVDRIFSAAKQLIQTGKVPLIK